MTPFPPEGSSQLAVLKARFVQNLRQANGQQMNDDLFREFTGGFVRSQLVLSTNECPAWYFGTNDEEAMLVVDGVTILPQVTAMVGAYSNLLNLGLTSIGSSYFYNAAVAIKDALIAMPGRRYTALHMGGWSAGGAILCNLPGLLGRTNIAAARKTLDTFGAPRAGITSTMTKLSTYCRTSRWMNADDPIPLFPFRVTDVPQLPVLIGVPYTLAWSHFVHPAGGRSLDVNGRVDAMELPELAQLSPMTSFSNWYHAWDTGNGLEHGITTYITRLERSESYYTHSGAPREGRVEAGGNHNVRELTQQEIKIGREVSALATSQNAGTTIVPPASRFKAVRISRLWYVTFGATLVAMPGTKKSAKSLARHGNEFIDSMQNKAVVFDAAMREAFDAHLTAAVTPNLGFRPVMNTKLPGQS
jgi:hypothetical protein